jgi:hypothetical protein
MPTNSGLDARAPLSISLCPPPEGRRASKRIALRQATNLMEAVAFAREVGTPLNAHATIHWAGTKVGDDPDGRLFAKVREGFDKWLKRQGIPRGLTAIWVRERRSGGSAEGWFTATCFSTLRTPLIAAESVFRLRGHWSG